jgi:glyoxylase-like metal-dependent hydrolase (beta-lactamase superfamily II)
VAVRAAGSGTCSTYHRHTLHRTQKLKHRSRSLVIRAQRLRARRSACFRFAGTAVDADGKWCPQSPTLNDHGHEIQLLLLGPGHTDGDIYVYLPQEKVVVTGDAVIDWMPFLNDGYPEEWVQTLTALEKVDFNQMILGHGEVATKEHLVFFKVYLMDLIASVKKAAADGGTLDEMKKPFPTNWHRNTNAACRNIPWASIVIGWG